MKKLFLLSLVSTLSFADPSVIIGEDQIVKLNTIDQASILFQNSRPTGRIRLPSKVGLHDYCTVSLISKNEIITAAHCLKDRKVLELTAYFEYYDKSTKNLNPFKVTALKMINEGRDLAILELENNPGDVYGHYAIAKTAPELNAQLLIYQHPGLDPKSLSHLDCAFIGFDSNRFKHTCDTENYSSGSPILNENFELVAIHQGAFGTMTEMSNYGQMVIDLIP